MNPNYPYQPYYNFQMPAQQQYVPQQAMQTAQPMQNVQQTAPQTINSLSGRIINAIEEVTPNEVAMNGSCAVFPMRDFSSIYIKSWSNDGTLKTIKFIPEVQTAPTETKDTAFNDSLVERLDRIEKLLKNNNNKKGETK